MPYFRNAARCAPRCRIAGRFLEAVGHIELGIGHRPSRRGGGATNSVGRNVEIVLAGVRVLAEKRKSQLQPEAVGIVGIDSCSVLCPRTTMSPGSSGTSTTRSAPAGKPPSIADSHHPRRRAGAPRSTRERDVCAHKAVMPPQATSIGTSGTPDHAKIAHVAIVADVLM